MSSHRERVRPGADRVARQKAVAELRLRVESGTYHVPADEVAAAMLAEAGFFEPDSSSWRGPDADAH